MPSLSYTGHTLHMDWSVPDGSLQYVPDTSQQGRNNAAAELLTMAGHFALIGGWQLRIFQHVPSSASSSISVWFMFFNSRLFFNQHRRTSLIPVRVAHYGTRYDFTITTLKNLAKYPLTPVGITASLSELPFCKAQRNYYVAAMAL